MFTHAGDERGGGGDGWGAGGVLALLLADIIGEQISPSDAKGAVAKKTHGDQKRARGGSEKEREREKKWEDRQW